MAELLLSCQDVSKKYGAEPLFEGLSFGIFEGDQVGLVGPNGSGKSTLLRILAGTETPDSGTRSVRKRLSVGYVLQDPEFPEDATVEAVLVEALERLHLEEFERHTRAAVQMGRAGFEDPAQRVSTLSGGWKKRLAIARELVTEPDLLLMDEPTNHLDVEGILWLEGLLKSQPLAFLVVSHDRWFLENVATRMLELSRSWAGGMFAVNGRYSAFLEKKDEALAGQAAYQETLQNRVRREVEWLRRGAKARTRKAQARIDEAGRMIDELDDVRARNATGTAGIEFTASDRKTKELLVVRGVTKRFDDRTVLRNLSLVLSPGKRLGLLGSNGSGKTTLLRLLSGASEPDLGTVKRAPNLKVVAFEQDRRTLDPTATLRRALAPYGDAVIYQGRSTHVGGWAKRFLFRSEQLEQPVSRLSGGEQARLLIAKLMLQEADVLLLDEPTNDLDIPTLEVLEESLMEFPGALVLVTHDRYLLDRVSTRILALDGHGKAELFADYPQWQAAQEEAARPVPRAAARAAAAVAPTPARKLSYKEKMEWEQMEARIIEAERALEHANAATHDPQIASDAAALQDRISKLTETQSTVERLYARWAELEAKTK
jgi:ATP-binding cassette subfamily F protein uup